MAFLAVLTAILPAACGGGNADQHAAPALSAAPAVALSTQLAEPAAGTLTLAWTFTLADGWHLYWDGLNDSGFPPSVVLALPDGWTAGPLRWPVPERHLMPGGILDHVFTGQLVLLQDLAPPGGARPASPTAIGAKVRWLACRNECVPGQADLTVTVPGAGTDLPAGFAGLPPYPAALPPGLVRAAWRADTLAVVVAGSRALRFFPAADSGPFLDLVADGEAAGDRLDLRLRGRDGAPGGVRGLLQIDRADGTRLTGPFTAPDQATDNPGG